MCRVADRTGYRIADRSQVHEKWGRIAGRTCIPCCNKLLNSDAFAGGTAVVIMCRLCNGWRAIAAEQRELCREMDGRALRTLCGSGANNMTPPTLRRAQPESRCVLWSVNGIYLFEIPPYLSVPPRERFGRVDAAVVSAVIHGYVVVDTSIAVGGKPGGARDGVVEESAVLS